MCFLSAPVVYQHLHVLSTHVDCYLFGHSSKILWKYLLLLSCDSAYKYAAMKCAHPQLDISSSQTFNIPIGCIFSSVAALAWVSLESIIKVSIITMTPTIIILRHGQHFTIMKYFQTFFPKTLSSGITYR